MKDKTALTDLISELENFKTFPMVHQATIEAAIDFAKLRLPIEKQQIIDAYMKDRHISMVNTPDEIIESYVADYISETFPQ